MEIHLGLWEPCHQSHFAARDEGTECAKDIIGTTLQFAVAQPWAAENSLYPQKKLSSRYGHR